MTASPIGSGVRGRLLISGPAAAAENMAIDAAILARARPESGPTLRFYSWTEPTLSLGYFQSLDQRTLHVESEQLPVVRRSTGGGAIVHDCELTYSLVIPASGGSLGAAPRVYHAVHDAFAQCLAEFGVRATRFADSGAAAPAGKPFLCFQRRTDEDLVVNQYKVLGSAQRRGSGGLLQHGSLLLTTSSAAPQLPGIAELSGRRITINDLVRPISEKLGAWFEVQWNEAELLACERATANSIASERFSSKAWTQRR